MTGNWPNAKLTLRPTSPKPKAAEMTLLPNLPIPDAATAQLLLSTALHQAQWARQNTLQLLDATPRDRWFEPATIDGDAGPQTISNLAWQVGHLTVSQYGLLMFRVFGRQADDLDLIPSRFRKAFSRGSDPANITADQYSADELWDRFNQVHERSLQGLTADIDPAVLLQPIDLPYAVYPITLGGILFCPLHEVLHSGQIGMLRRLLGLPPIR